jgi:hypothetical protein
VTTIKAKEPQAILTIEKHKVSLLIDTEASILSIPYLALPYPGPPRKLLFRAYQASPWSVISLSL